MMLDGGGDNVSLSNFLTDMTELMYKNINRTILLEEQKQALINRVREFRKELLQDLSVKHIENSQSNFAKKELNIKGMEDSSQNSPKKERSLTATSPRVRPQIKFSLSSNNITKYRQDLMEPAQDTEKLLLEK